MTAADPTKFYALSEGVRGIGLMQSTRPLIDARAVIRGQGLPSESVPFAHNVGSVPGDLIMCGDPDVLLVSDLVQQVLKNVRATGWTTYPVAPTGKRATPILGYVGLGITGRAGEPRYDLSERFKMRFVPNSPDTPSLRGVTFDVESWDGSDLFILGETGWKIVSESVRSALKAARVRNSVSNACLTSKTRYSHCLLRPAQVTLANVLRPRRAGCLIRNEVQDCARGTAIRVRGDLRSWSEERQRRGRAVSALSSSANVANPAGNGYRAARSIE
jgi:hypothetical protein